MRITSFEIHRYKLPFTEPLTLKGATLGSREGLLLRITGGGSEGWGEAAPLPGFSRETVGEAADQLLESCEKMVRIGRLPSGDTTSIFHPDTAPSVRFAVELATLNLDAARRGVSALGVLHLEARGSLLLSSLLSGSEDEVVAEARRMREAGYWAIKLKVGRGRIEDDARLVREVSPILGDGVSLRLDANRAWSLDGAMDFARSVRDVRIEYIEEPLADPALLPRFADKSGVPVALDESLVGMRAEDLGDHRYAAAVVLKPTLLGGISRTLRMAEEANTLGMTPVISSAYESGVGTRGLISVSAAIGDAPAGLDTYRRLAEDVLIPRLELDVPTVNVRDALEAPREIDPDRLELIARF